MYKIRNPKSIEHTLMDINSQVGSDIIVDDFNAPISSLGSDPS